MEETGIRSLLNVPIRTDGRLLGVVGFDAERSQKSWPEEDVRLLQTVAENFTHLLLREEALHSLREHAWYLEGLDRVSSVLAGGQPGFSVPPMCREQVTGFRWKSPGPNIPDSMPVDRSFRMTSSGAG